MKSKFFIYHDAYDLWFIRHGLGVFWQSGPRSEAKEFQTRSAAVKTLHECRQHLRGWRVIVERG